MLHDSLCIMTLSRNIACELTDTFRPVLSVVLAFQMDQDIELIKAVMLFFNGDASMERTIYIVWNFSPLLALMVCVWIFMDLFLVPDMMHI